MSKESILVGIISLFCALITLFGQNLRAATNINDPILAIESDFREGRLTLDEKVMLQIKAIKKPYELPQKYQLFDLATGKTVSRSVTMALKEIRIQWEQLSLETQQAFNQAFARWSTEYTYDSPGGFFKLHYDTTGTHKVPAADDDASGVPDFVEKCAAYCDTTYDAHILMGFLEPPPDGGLGGDEKFDIYFENMGYYGYAQPEGPGPEPWNDYYSYIVLNSDFLGFPPNDDPEGDQYGAAKVTVAHEFHHSTQFAYDINEGMWFMELDAVCLEDIIFDHSNDNYNYLHSFFDYPEKSLLENTSHAYSCFIWGLFLAQKFDTSLLVAIWEGARYDDVFNTLSDTLSDRYGWTQDSAFAEFATWNYCTYHRDDGQHHEEGGNYPYVTIGRSHSSYPVNFQTSPTAPAGYGSCYVQFFPQSVTGILRLTFNGDDSREWAAYLIKSIGMNEYEFEKLVLDSSTYYGQLDVFEFESYLRVTLVAINLSEFSNGAFFNYSAEILQPYACSSIVLTTDSAVYSGGEREFEYQVFNTSSLNDVFDISFHDDLGWITPDTIDKALSPGGDTVFSIPVHPPQGTPLETTSNLYFKVCSRGDTTVSDSQTVVAKTMLQHGDSDFSGQIDVSDITYLVAFLFTNGSSPIPVLEAGDFDCDSKIRITDLTAMVAYLFTGGEPSSCNPY